jgi:hypothetical protein
MVQPFSVRAHLASMNPCTRFTGSYTVSLASVASSPHVCRARKNQWPSGTAILKCGRSTGHA